MLEPGTCWGCLFPAMEKIKKDLWRCPQCSWEINTQSPKRTKKVSRDLRVEDLPAYFRYLEG